MNRFLDYFIKIFNFINPFSRKIVVHLVSQNMEVYQYNVTLTYIPRVDEEIFFEPNGDVFQVVRVLHFYNLHRQIVYVMIAPINGIQSKIIFDLTDD